MTKTWVTDLIDRYYEFLKGRTAIVTETGTDWAVISTPFIGLFNDTLEIYAKRQNGTILLSDDGITIKNLELTGSAISRSPKRRELLENILRNYDIQFEGNEFVTKATEQTFPQKKHNLISAISEINDMYMLAKHTVASMFREDVQSYLDEQHIIYTPQFISRGSTGLEFTFDFQVAYRDKEIIIQSFNVINKNNLPKFLFTWDDIKIARERVTKKQVVGLAVVNDEEKDVQGDYLEALKSRNADYILWSQRNKPENVSKLRMAA